jgi:hypothetical protein
VKRKLMATLLPAVAFAAFAIAPALAQASAAKLYFSGTEELVPTKTTVQLTTTLTSSFVPSGYPVSCDGQITATIFENPGAIIKTTGSNFSDPGYKHCYQPLWNVEYEPVVSVGSKFKMYKPFVEPTAGHVSLNSPWQYNFYYYEGSEFVTCYMYLESEGSWALGSSYFGLKGLFTWDSSHESPAPFCGGQGGEIEMSGGFELTTSSGTPIVLK